MASSREKRKSKLMLKTTKSTVSDESVGFTYTKDEQPRNPEEWKKWKSERKLKKRKWKEDKLIKLFEKKKKLDEAKVESKRREDDEEEIKEATGRVYTVSIALPGSILDNAQTPELRTYLAGQIARAAVVFNVDEIVIFDEVGEASTSSSTTTEGNFQGVGKKGKPNIQMARILQYLECPQYLRKSFFPQHKDLQYAGLLNPLDCPHHVKADVECLYREGVVVDVPVKEGRGSYVNVGLLNSVSIDKKLLPGVRVTVKLKSGYLERIANKKTVRGEVVLPSTPRTDGGLYWGYNVRLARSLGAVFTESPYEDGYDCQIGTSDQGSSVDQTVLDKFSHLLIVFGGVKGLEYSLDGDQDLHIEEPSLLFNHYLNTCPSQGSNTIRTEEAILISLSALRPKILETLPKEKI